MFSVGERLKRARLDQGLELSAIAARTKITKSYLEAIESDDRKKLPGGFFYRSFVHQDARALSLDTSEIDAEIDRLLAGDAALPLPGQDGKPIRPREAQVRIRSPYQRTLPVAAFATLMLTLWGASEIYGWWRIGRLQPTVSSSAVPSKEERAGASSTLSNDASAHIKTPSAPPSDLSTLASGPTTPASESRVLLDLKANEETWLSASSDGQPVFSGTLFVDATKTIEGKRSAKLRIGNAAGLEVRLNGKPLGPLGARGQVLEVLFTGDSFEIVSHAKEGA